MAARNFVFDISGTVADLTGGYRVAYSAAFRELGMQFDPEQTQRYMGMPVSDVFTENNRGCTCMYRDFATMVIATYDRNVRSTAASYPDVRGCLAALSAEGCGIGALTTGYELHAAAILDELGISDMFASVVGVERTAVQRPHPYSLELCMRELGAARCTVTFVTASEEGVEMGKRAGVRTVLLDRSGTVGPGSGPDRYINGLDELLERKSGSGHRFPVIQRR